MADVGRVPHDDDIAFARSFERSSTMAMLADDNFGRAAASAEYRSSSSEIARCYLRLLVAYGDLQARTLPLDGDAFTQPEIDEARAWGERTAAAIKIDRPLDGDVVGAVAKVIDPSAFVCSMLADGTLIISLPEAAQEARRKASEIIKLLAATRSGDGE